MHSASNHTANQTNRIISSYIHWYTNRFTYSVEVVL